MSELSYVIGDATEPHGEGAKIIPHIVNDEGKWGKGFVLALSAKWSEPERDYQYWANSSVGPKLGITQLTMVEKDIFVANMCAQHGVRSSIFVREPIRYGALVHCMEQVERSAYERQASIHAPRFGAGLAGGHWPTIEALILELWVDHDIDVTVYDLPAS